jgi:V/A-type H+/Na+-transporting ATPase subunit I
MIFTTPMRLLAAIVLDETSEEVSKELLRQGVLDFISIRDLPGEWKDHVEPLPPNVAMARIGELRKRLEGIINIAERPLKLPEPSVDNLAPLDLGTAEKSLVALAAEVDGIRDRQKVSQDEILKLQEIRRQIELFDNLKATSGSESSYSFLMVRMGTVPASRLESLEQSFQSLPSVVLPSKQTDGPSVGIQLVTLKRDDARVQPLLHEAGWEDMTIPEYAKDSKEEALHELDSKIAALQSRQSECRTEQETLFEKKADQLSSLWAGLRTNELLTRVRSSFSHTSRTILFSGWIPQDRQAAVEKGIRKASGGKCYLEWISPDQGEAKKLSTPVAMKNPKALAPFEMLVRNYAVPEYGTVDPTPFVSVAYLCMFGLMFGDAGHGLVVALIGLLGIFFAKKKKKGDNLFRLFVYCGCAAIVAGILFGSYFGHEWFPPLWFDYHGIVAGHAEHLSGAIHDIYDILGITIKFGMAVLGLGFVLNWVNLIHKKRFLPLLLDKGGLLGGWIYAAGAWAAFYFVGHNYKGLPPTKLLFLILGIPTLILALKAPVEYIVHNPATRKKFGPLSLVDFFMEWIVEVLEIYSGYLANTLSFMRVAGLGIAHVSLMAAFAQIARMITPEGPLSIWAIVILVLGNILVIALEGLSAGIQSLRLNYYEFFSKYFNGTGRAYNPISLHVKE